MTKYKLQVRVSGSVYFQDSGITLEGAASGLWTRAVVIGDAIVAAEDSIVDYRVVAA